ncbi:cyclophilin-like fold protein [Shouchella hunanensis]|uniref:Cyclophilin-like fold protein n=1 Tax=Shouchella hunanensis TaxID=766894 RepID=A0ABY7W9E1_9BACI|nr:cyclophilin-like fold protein [Shouchella hunanensis]WDF05543.1 cyclophilin-like fold protein [Shouchella hunanensis]
MNYKKLVIFTLVFFLIGCSTEDQIDSNEDDNIENDITNNDEAGEINEGGEERDLEDQIESEVDSMNQIQFTFENGTFNGVLYENETTNALIEQLPLSITMVDLHNNEKYYDLDESLPTQSERVNNISKGDLMLFNSNTLVLFYEDFSTSYSYTKLGYVEDPDQLGPVLGTGDIEVNIQLIN